MNVKSHIPVYINYGKRNFFKTYNLFKEFLKTVPYEKLQFQDSVNRSAGIIVSPRNNSGIPWCNITIALFYAYKNMPFKIILDDLNFLDPEWKYQLNAVQETVEYICNNLNTSYLRTSMQVDTDLDDFDHKEIKRLSIINGIWNVRNVVPSENLNQYIDLSHITLEANAKKIKGLYSTNNFEHCVHQSLVNNNGGLHKWFGRKYGIRISCMDISQGRGLVGIKDVPGYNSDLPDIIENNMTDFLDSKENKRIAKNEAIKEHKLRKKGEDSRTYQIVSTNKSNMPVEVDILIPINIFWDAASLGKNRFFENPLFWLQETIDFILIKTTARVVVRQHPAEREFELYGTGKKLGEYLQNQFGKHPRFRFISCNDNINTYSLIEQCKIVLPHTSTVGIEAALMGKKVIIESSVYYKDQPFVVKAESKEDYFNKIKQFYEQYDQAHNNKKDNNGYEKALLLYFLLTQCSIIESKFGLDPTDFENWAPRGFDFLTRDENLMTAIEALISARPFPYLNGKKKLENIKDRLQRVIDWPRVHDKEIIQRINHLINLINNHNYEEALGMMPDSIEHDGVYLYPRAFVLAKLNRFNEANEALNRLNSIKPNHQYSRFLVNEVKFQNFVRINTSTSKSNGNQVVGVVSPSYSGSTLLTAVLGAHSKIFAAGEVRWLIERNIFDVEKLIERSKNLSKKDTVPWQNKTFRTANYSNVYKKIFEVIDSNFIIDSSKEPHHFQNILNNTQDNGIHFLFISLWKHPMRLLSSHLMHRWDRWEQFRNYARGDAINYVINDLYKKYISIKEFLASTNKGLKTLFIKYEDIVENLQPTLQRILDEIHLEYEIGMENYGEKEQYILGGNAGPRYKIAKIQNGIETEFASPIQRDFYQNMKGIEMDNNYRKFFSTDEIHSIYDDEKFKFLMNSLKYSNIY